MSPRIAYIDDSIDNLEVLQIILDKYFQVETFQDPIQFLEIYPTTSYAAIIVDIHMPNINGFSLYERIIESLHYNGCPILFLSSDDTDEARIRSFELGAVDFMSRELLPAEIVSRVTSKIKFFEKHRHIIEFGDLRMNLTQLKTYLKGHELPLTFIELKMLSLLIRNYPDIVPKEQIIDQVWKKALVLDATLYTHVSNLKIKLKDWDHEIQSVKSKGLQIVKRNT